MTLKRVKTTGKIIKVGGNSIGVLLPVLIKELMEFKEGDAVNIIYDDKLEAVIITK